MKINNLHGFDLSFEEAKEIQLELAERLIIKGGPSPKNLHLVAGCDVAFDKKSNRAFGCLVLFSFPELNVLQTKNAIKPIRFPYVPGYLSFRELEILLALFKDLQRVPDVVLVDGQGIAHPRRIGLASHLGLFLGVPTIGCAKSRLVGEHGELSTQKGEKTPLIHDGTQVGYLLRTRDSVRPMFISPGHLIGLDRAAEIALACTGKYRMPEPTRRADIAVSKFKKEVLRGETE